jgi:hypothetical protein
MTPFLLGKAARDFASMTGDGPSGLPGYRSVLLRFIDLVGAFCVCASFLFARAWESSATERANKLQSEAR